MCSLFRGLLHGLMRPSLIPVRSISNLHLPKDYSHIVLPENEEDRKLSSMPKAPVYPVGIKQFYMSREKTWHRGPEEVHNQLIHGQYGVQVLRGCELIHGHLEMMKLGINRLVNFKKFYAIWRIDPPWKPRTKRGISRRMGGGKGSIKYYTTPVKEGRIVLEVIGKGDFEEVQRALGQIAHKLPVPARAVTQEMLDDEQVLDEWKERANLNPYTFEYMLRNNMLGCHKWISHYDLKWFGKYR